MPRRTRSGKKTAVADVEDRLKDEYGEGKEADHKVFGTLNKIGLKRGSKTTAKGMKPMKQGNGRKLPKVPSAARDMAMLKRRRMSM